MDVSASSVAAPDDADLITTVQSLPRGNRAREAACEELVRRYRSLVLSCAAQYRHSPEPQEELIQAGYLGLMNAINHFDPRFGTSLTAYARPCISGEIKRHFRDKRWQLRVRRAAQEIRAEVLKAEAELVQCLSRLPTNQDIADYLQVSLEDVEEGRSAEQAFRALSLDAPLAGDSEAGTLADLLGGEDSELGTSLDMESVWTHISELPAREQEIVALRFYGNMTQAQIGEKLGISQMHVSRLLSHALTVLRNQLLSDGPGTGGAD